MTASLATDMSRLGVTMHPESRLGKGCLASEGYVPGTFPLLWDVFHDVVHTCSHPKMPNQYVGRLGFQDDMAPLAPLKRRPLQWFHPGGEGTSADMGVLP